MTIKGVVFNLFQKIHNMYQLRRVRVVGNAVNVFGKINIIYPKNLRIGDSCSFNHGAYINAFSPVSIGNDVTVSAGAKIIATGIDYIAWSNGNKGHIAEANIVIGDHVWIGANAQILAGVSISGTYVVVAAGAVVTKDISESRVIVAGCPARVVKRF